MLKLGDILAEGRAYPLFDDRTGSLVAAGVAEGLFSPHRESLFRGRQIGAAAHLMSYLPAFPSASVSEILAIRNELMNPLIRFRSAVVKLAHLIDSAPYEPDFSVRIEELYRDEVAPAVLEIREQVESNRFLQQLAGEAVRDIPKWLGAGFIALATTPGATFRN